MERGSKRKAATATPSQVIDLRPPKRQKPIVSTQKSTVAFCVFNRNCASLYGESRRGYIGPDPSPRTAPTTVSATPSLNLLHIECLRQATDPPHMLILVDSHNVSLETANGCAQRRVPLAHHLLPKLRHRQQRSAYSILRNCDVQLTRRTCLQ